MNSYLKGRRRRFNENINSLLLPSNRKHPTLRPEAGSSTKDGLEAKLHVLSAQTQKHGNEQCLKQKKWRNQLPNCNLGDRNHGSGWAGSRCTHWINFPSRESSFSSRCSLSSSLACFLRMFSLSSSRHLAFSIISCRFRSSSSDESFLLNTKIILSGLLLSKQQKGTASGRREIR